MADWQKIFEEKLGTLLSVKESLSEDEAAKMGRKDPEQEMEKFVLANTQELGKDKWLCPLSGKKFKVCDITCCFVHLVSLDPAGRVNKTKIIGVQFTRIHYQSFCFKILLLDIHF